jgi:hypothetical protein
MRKQNSSIKAQIIRSAFILLAFTAMAALPFALAQRQNSVKQSVHAPPLAAGTIATVKTFPPISQSFSSGDHFQVRFTPMEAYVIDLGQLGIQPLPFKLPPHGGPIRKAAQSAPLTWRPPPTWCHRQLLVQWARFSQASPRAS